MSTRIPTLHQLEIFMAVAREGGFRRAANALLISEPVVSQQMRSLEQTLGIRLVDRLPGRPVQITRAGQRLRETCAEVFRLLEKAADEFEALNRADRASVTFGARPAFAGQLLPLLYASLLQEAPNIELRLVTGSPDALLTGLSQKQLDLVVVGDTESDYHLTRDKLATIDIVLIGQPNHRLAGRSHAPFHSLAGERLIVADHSHVTRRLQSQAIESGIALDIVWDASNAEAQISAVKAGLGIAAVPFYAVRERVDAGTLSVLNVEGFPLGIDHFVFGRAEERSASVLQVKTHLLNHGGDVDAVSVYPTHR